MTPELEKAIEKARNHVMTPEEKFEQRVSFVYGQHQAYQAMRSFIHGCLRTPSISRGERG